jgi:hypothetical protein
MPSPGFRGHWTDALNRAGFSTDYNGRIPSVCLFAVGPGGWIVDSRTAHSGRLLNCHAIDHLRLVTAQALTTGGTVSDCHAVRSSTVWRVTLVPLPRATAPMDKPTP